MPVKKAKDDKKKPEDVYRGASGGLAPEGYSLPNLVRLQPSVEGVSVRSSEEDDKRFQQAEKFQRSKAEFDKKLMNPKKEEVPVQNVEVDKKVPVEADVKKNNK